MPLFLADPEKTTQEIIEFLQETFRRTGKQHVVIAVSGGIDSALSVTLLSRAVPKDQIFPLFLPYRQQSTEDAKAICAFSNIPQANWQTIQIDSIVDAAASLTLMGEKEYQRKGNLMARARMMLVFDRAKEKNALVCGTENKSEHYLGYFTRFGDAASDIEPICHLYKTQVRQLADYWSFPLQFLSKPPSAGLWEGQTDEQEMGFSYEVADQVLYQLIDEKIPAAKIEVPGVDPSVVQAVLKQLKNMAFKLQVPYQLEQTSSTR